MCRKKFENRLTNKNLTSKNVSKLLPREVTIFSEKIKSFNILLLMQKNKTK